MAGFSLRLPLRLPVCAALALTCLTVTANADTRRMFGRDYLPVETVAASLGLNLQALEGGDVAQLSSEWTELTFREHKRFALLNGTPIHLGFPVAKSGNDLYIADVDWQRNLQPVLTPQIYEKVPKLYRIILDPGHGGRDPGAESANRSENEKTNVLDLALRIERILEPIGYDVVLTRTSDTYIPLADRSALANARNADLFISLHFNATSSTRVSGVETYCLTPQNQPSTSRTKLHASDLRWNPGNEHDAWNALAALYVQKELVAATGADNRGVRRARFTVLTDLECPGVLVEAGFLSNPAEARKIGTAAYRQTLAEAIARGILRYQDTLNRLRGL